MSRKCDLPLHGLTVVVDTPGPRVYIGRYDHEDEDGIVLKDVDVRDIGPDTTKDAWIRKSAQFGVFRNADHAHIPRREVVSVRRLSEVEVD